MQLSGIHIHIDLEPTKEITRNLNLYDIGDHVSGHDHDTSIDINIFELNTSWSKVFLFFISTVALLISFYNIGRYLCPFTPSILRYDRNHFWRPILRAPPQLH